MRHVINIVICQHIDIYAVLCIKKNCAQSYRMSVSRIVPIAFLLRQENNGLLALPKQETGESQSHIPRGAWRDGIVHSRRVK